MTNFRICINSLMRSFKTCVARYHTLFFYLFENFQILIQVTVPTFCDFWAQDDSVTSSDSLLTSSDAVRLQEIFDDLAERKDDAQQRSWYLHADEHVISGA